MAYEAYIDRVFYAETYQGIGIDTDIFDRLASRASDELDKLTFQRVRLSGLNAFEEDTQAAIKFATCAITEALAQVEKATDGTGLMMASESVGSYSYSADGKSLDKLLAEARSRAMTYLIFTGLLYSGV